MRIIAHWEDCTPKLIEDFPEICSNGVRQLKLQSVGYDDMNEYKSTGHQHLVVRGRRNFIWAEPYED